LLDMVAFTISSSDNHPHGSAGIVFRFAAMTTVIVVIVTVSATTTTTTTTKRLRQYSNHSKCNRSVVTANVAVCVCVCACVRVCVLITIQLREGGNTARQAPLCVGGKRRKKLAVNNIKKEKQSKSRYANATKRKKERKKTGYIHVPGSKQSAIITPTHVHMRLYDGALCRTAPPPPPSLYFCCGV
jgi:hypothetical protein